MFYFVKKFSRKLKLNFFADADSNADADAELPMPGFPNGPLPVRPFGNLGIGISASALALTSASASALQEIHFVLQSLYFCLSKFYMKKTFMVKYFSSTLADLPV